jgi:hypothetical protein
MDAVLVAAAVLVGVVGLLLMSNATAGVGVICFACLLAVFARMTQAHRQHADLMTALRTGPTHPAEAAPETKSAAFGFPRDPPR